MADRKTEVDVDHGGWREAAVQDRPQEEHAMAEGPEQPPPLIERVLDGVTDVQFATAQATEQLAEAGQRLVHALHVVRRQPVANSLAAMIRANPFVATGAAFLLGVWAARRR